MTASEHVAVCQECAARPWMELADTVSLASLWPRRRMSRQLIIAGAGLAVLGAAEAYNGSVSRVLRAVRRCGQGREPLRLFQCALRAQLLPACFFTVVRLPVWLLKELLLWWEPVFLLHFALTKGSHRLFGGESL